MMQTRFQVEIATASLGYLSFRMQVSEWLVHCLVTAFQYSLWSGPAVREYNKFPPHMVQLFIKRFSADSGD